MSPVVGPVGQSVRLSCPVQCCDVPGSPLEDFFYVGGSVRLLGASRASGL